jgi:hypothetical protein
MDNFSFRASDLEYLIKNLHEAAIKNCPQYSVNCYQNFFNSEEIAPICDYLNNPTKIGVWFFKFRWLENEGISSEIKYEIEEVRNNNPDAYELLLSVYENENELLKTIDSYYFIFSLFKYICRKEEESDLDFNKKDLKTFQALDIEKIKEKYQKAYELFKNEIHYEMFNSGMAAELPFRTKRGSIFATKRNGIYSSYMSISFEPLENIKEFYLKVGKIKDWELRPEYSPDDVVFIPYFLYLERAYLYITEDSKVVELLKRVIDEYQNKDFENCIRTSGLIAEYYLKQIYETFFKIPIPKNTTLNEIYTLIVKELNSHFQKNKVASNKEKLFTEIKDLRDNFEVDEKIRNEKTLTLMLKILGSIKEDEKEFKQSLFPTYLQHNIIESIRLRNATSHDSRIPIGQYEAQKMVYCCITLIMWWRNEKNKIDWKDQKNILEDTVERNNPVSKK